MLERFEIVEQSDTEIKLKEKATGAIHRRYKAYCSLCKKDRGWQKRFKQFKPCKSCALHQEFILSLNKTTYPNADFKDSIIHYKKNGGTETRYKAKCTSCLKDRGYITLTDVNKECRSCSRKTVHKKFSHQQKTAQAQKISMVQTGDKSFSGFRTAENDKQRGLFKSQELSKQCFERDDFTCRKCQIRGTTLNAHHLNGFDKFPEERFLLENLITLCKNCHDSFHSTFGKGRNTKEQWEHFQADPLFARKELYMLIGAPASGKSWVLSNLFNFDCLDSDSIPKKELINKIKAATKPIVSLTIGISTFIKNNPDLDIKLVVIVEGINTLNQRMIDRGGKITSTIERRAKRMDALVKQAIFSGSSEEVLNYLENIV